MPLPGASDVRVHNSVGGTAVLVFAGRIIVTAVRAINASGADAYVQLFDAATTSAVTVGTTIPRWVVLTDIGAGDVSVGDGLPSNGLVFSNGLVIASTTSATGSTGATQHVRICHI